MRFVCRAVLVCMVMAAAARATTVIPMSVDELTRAADTIVEATATNSWSQWNAQHTIIVTYTRFTVIKSLKGAPAGEILVKQPGGIVGFYGQKIPGVRDFLIGETALLFLEPSKDGDGNYVVVGLVQGNFRLFRSSAGVKTVTNGMPGVSAMRARDGITEYKGTTMPLSEIETRIQGTRSQ